MYNWQSLLFLTLFCKIAAGKIDSDFERVTCGSYVKLTHEPTQFKLHSHKINYASGSEQQVKRCNSI
jgi:dolichyl-phosphate-mannose--protein O-mannosyl transferase